MKKKRRIKRKVWIIGLIIIIISLSLTSFIIIKINNEKKAFELQQKLELERLRKEKRITEIKQKYGAFTNGKRLETDDSLSTYFNSIIDTHDKINSLKVNSPSIEDIKNLKDSISKLQIKKEEANKIVYDKIDQHLSNLEEFEKEEILKIYNNSEIIKNIDSDSKKINDYTNAIDSLIKKYSFFVDNPNRYYIENNKIIYKGDDFYKEYKKLDLGLPIAKEVDYGKEIPILMYHGVKDKPWGNTSLFVTESAFEQQMKYLHDAGYTTLFLSEITKAKNYEKPIIITFDDGYLDMYTTAYPIMKKYNIKSNMYIITGWLDGNIYMTPNMVKELDSSGIVEIGSHTKTHIHLGATKEEEQEIELKDSKDYLENLLGHEINTIAYPYGSRNSKTLAIAKKYYKYAITTDNGYNYDKQIAGYSLILKRKNIARGLGLDNYKTIVGGTKKPIIF